MARDGHPYLASAAHILVASASPRAICAFLLWFFLVFSEGKDVALEFSVGNLSLYSGDKIVFSLPQYSFVSFKDGKLPNTGDILTTARVFAKGILPTPEQFHYGRTPAQQQSWSGPGVELIPPSPPAGASFVLEIEAVSGKRALSRLFIPQCSYLRFNQEEASSRMFVTAGPPYASTPWMETVDPAERFILEAGRGPPGSIVLRGLDSGWLVSKPPPMTPGVTSFDFLLILKYMNFIVLKNSCFTNSLLFVQ